VLRALAGSAAPPPEVEISPAGASGLTVWADGLHCVWINTANAPGRYRNLFWRESRSKLAGQVLFLRMAL
jgi:hypothetical protein